jgi:hypothetical protein
VSNEVKYNFQDRPEVKFTVDCEPEEIPIRGNCSAIDEETDRETEEWILSELNSGNPWAWCQIVVKASLGEFEGHAYLGGCSYKSKEDFIQANDYYLDMKDEALEELDKKIQDTLQSLPTQWIIEEINRRNCEIANRRY